MNSTALYIRVKWIHSDPYEPIEFYYEIGEGSWASRGIEVFADGSLSSTEHGNREAPIPSLDEINSDAQFQGVEISRDEFEEMWNKLSA